MEYVLQTNNLSKSYKKVKVLDSVSLHVPKGSIYGFVGRNGAGKTTLMRVISALNSPSSGDYSLYGMKNIDPKIAEARQKVGAVVETPSIYLNLNAYDNLLLQYKLHGMKPDGIEELLKLVGLANTGKKKAKDFSLGMRQRLSIAFSLVSNPDFLILDEPINGLDPQGIVEVRDLIHKLNTERGITILISSHILDELAKLATYYGFIDKGRLIKEMSADDLEKACSKCVRITVNDTKLLAPVLEEMDLKYAIISETEAEIYSHIAVTPLVLALADKGCQVITMHENNESLESYFIGLIGGAHNA